MLKSAAAARAARTSTIHDVLADVMKRSKPLIGILHVCESYLTFKLYDYRMNVAISWVSCNRGTATVQARTRPGSLPPVRPRRCCESSSSSPISSSVRSQPSSRSIRRIWRRWSIC
ncbi:hypothetical protein MIC448_790012 [Microbacterium sp. C448]|nr:hypothetical protein MIC448_790012 [Microbacterium sp. C448]